MVSWCIWLTLTSSNPELQFSFCTQRLCLQLYCPPVFSWWGLFKNLYTFFSLPVVLTRLVLSFIWLLQNWSDLPNILLWFLIINDQFNFSGHILVYGWTLCFSCEQQPCCVCLFPFPFLSYPNQLRGSSGSVGLPVNRESFLPTVTSLLIRMGNYNKERIWPNQMASL